MIKELTINWENCFGIKKLCHTFKYSPQKHVQMIYAPNGSMKTSFAKTMMYLSGQSTVKPLDKLCPEAIAKYEINVDGKQVPKENIYVINGEDNIDSSSSFVNFLASKELKEKYDEIYKNLSEAKDKLISKLIKASQSSDCEKEMFSAFRTSYDDTIFSVLEKLQSLIEKGFPLYVFKYNDIFDSSGKVKAFIDKYSDKIQQYIVHYESLLEDSVLYKKIGDFTFGTYHSEQLSKFVADGNFFGVNHKIKLSNGYEISSLEDLDLIIKQEDNRIFSDEKLKKLFKKITSAFDKNNEVRLFKRILENHPKWIPEIINYEEFKKKVWLGYLSSAEIKPLYDSYITVYNENKAILNDILEKAGKEQERWKDIIELYNSRFQVPVRVAIRNQKDVILKKEAAQLNFFYKDEEGHLIQEEEKSLNEILSKGEKRAFTILQFIFEAESRKLAEHDSIFVMDDIADSFDYQNKYAILEYIKDLAEDTSDKFYLIILTHNYDFYRTLSSRLSSSKPCLYMVDKTKKGEISLLPGKYIGNIYQHVFVGHDDNDKKFICMIPFVRNLIEYTKGDSSDEFKILTQCLHIKDKTKNITQTEVMDIIKNYTYDKGLKRQQSQDTMYNLIINTAKCIFEEEQPNPILIENKIVLSIAIRLIAEQYIHDLLILKGKKEEELACSGNQTGEWTKKYKSFVPDDTNKCIIERVNMMTPELIHINSFMFEPLIDMSLHHLLQLYDDCKRKLIVKK